MFLSAAIHENRCSERKWPREKFSRRDTRQREAQLRYKTRERPRSQARNRRDTKVPRIRDFKEKRRHSPWKNYCRKTTTFNPRGKPKREAASEPIRQSWELPGSWLTSSAWHAVLFHSPVPHDARTSNRFTRNKERPRASNWLHLLLGRFFSGIYSGRKRTFPRITLCFLGTICDSLSTTHRLAVKMNNNNASHASRFEKYEGETEQASWKPEQDSVYLWCFILKNDDLGARKTVLFWPVYC